VTTLAKHPAIVMAANEQRRRQNPSPLASNARGDRPLRHQQVFRYCPKITRSGRIVVTANGQCRYLPAGIRRVRFAGYQDGRRHRCSQAACPCARSRRPGLRPQRWQSSFARGSGRAGNRSLPATPLLLLLQRVRRPYWPPAAGRGSVAARAGWTASLTRAEPSGSHGEPLAPRRARF
jgi:hypothetical protein